MDIRELSIMMLIKENKEKGRKVYELSDRFRKVWITVEPERLEQHVVIMNKILPGYVINWGSEETSQFLDVKKVLGTPASKFEHTPEFIKKVYNFCLDNIEETSPYAHFDWVLSNIMVDGDKMRMVDWDNIGIYSKEQIMNKLHSDLTSAFGDKFDTAIL
jgi:hypothetical protein